ncbi:hypothetical protein LTR99_002013 [Exophiala xenobiotica]|uniref:O-methyltransferase C-terminal domain-containing protein n=1 Tax=Vermiconidia calcicola TaxID=1690605 RepID=A0AAV9QH09_9PEZI|nr:hypothetical protein H2202_007350 [Exophiala xenobiotica]KAK5529880.1 hypothetical protein LTR23_010569 [Chaetothyriales sp. CCFEE 6169]KAK5542649.1 hypothetical protein LTR25_002535 [Vermiconidia calcicola]KAK5195491.1 hypothetical protein LTR92_004431 [Exophiala xenobiotica]KAK5226209.1 hypothetical protein LTR72_004113 [Exophiala xenobiotica]
MLDSKVEDLEALAETCLKTAKQIKEYLASNNLPQPTFDQNGPEFFPPVIPEIDGARLELRAAAKRLYDLAAGPDEVLTWHTYHCAHDLNAFRYVHRYNVPSAVPLNSSITYPELASKLSLDASQLKQMLRQLMAIHVFHEPSPGLVAHTASSRLLSHWGVGSFNNFIAEDTFPVAAKVVEALEHYGHGRQEPNRAALNFTHNTDLVQYEWYETQPALRDRFSKIMTFMSKAPVMANEHVARGFDWKSLPADSTVVDVAGNVGHCSVSIAEANSSLKIIVQDLPKIIAHASNPETSVIPEPLRSRFTFMEHSFFNAQPVRGAAVYFLRMIMHDYSDEYALKILRPIVQSMSPHSKIVIMDQLMPPTVGVLPYDVERMMRTTDLQMMMLTNAKERDEEEWKDLVARAGEGLVQDVFTGADADMGKGKKLGIKNIQTPPGSTLSVIEVGFVDEQQEPNGTV